MAQRADGPDRYLGDALDRRDEAMWRTRRMMTMVAAGAVTSAVALGVVFAQELPGHSVSPAPSGGGAAPPASGPAGAQPPASTSGGAQTQAPPPSPTPAAPQVVSGGS